MIVAKAGRGDSQRIKLRDSAEKNLGPYLWMLTSAVCFAGMGAFTRSVADDCPWQMLAAIRSAIALCIAFALAWSAGVKPVVFQPRTLWIRSFAGTGSMVLTFYALTHLPIADALTLTNMFPLWVALLSWPILGRKPGVVDLLAVVVALSGILIMYPPTQSGPVGPAVFAGIGASLFTSVAMLGLHRLKAIDSRAIVIHFSAVATLTNFFLWFTVGNSFPESFFTSIIPATKLLVLGLFATAGQLCLTKAFTHGSPTRVSVVGLTQVVFAVAIDRVFWDRQFAVHTIIGIALVLFPTAWLLIHLGSRSSAKPEEEADRTISP